LFLKKRSGILIKKNIGSLKICEEEGIQMIKTGKYRHFKGKEYEVIGIARHSETLGEMVVYRALYGDGGLWVRSATMWEEPVEFEGRVVQRFTYIG